MPTKGKVVLVDGNSLLYRAFFAMPHFSTVNNQPTNAVYGFTMMLLRLIEEGKPDILIVTFDAPVKTFRHDEYEEYKAHRKPTPEELKSQGPLAREVVDAFRIPLLEVEGFEADDVIGTVARRASEEGYDVTIVTGDKDAFQLVNPQVKVMITVKGVTETKIYDEAAVEERYGLRPDQLRDFKALVGDPSDNIPGVKGIGEKTAEKLVNQFGTIENLYDQLESVENVKLRRLLSNSAENAVLSKRLATIVTDVPLSLDLSKCRAGNLDIPALRDLFGRLEFHSLLKRLPVPAPKIMGQGTLFGDTSAQEPIAPKSSIVRSRAELSGMLEDVNRSSGVAIRMNATSERGVSAEVKGLMVCSSDEKAYYIPFGGETGFELDDLRKLIENDNVPKFGHNLKFDEEICLRNGLSLRGAAFDVMLAGYLMNPTRGTHSLNEIASDYAGIQLPVRDTGSGTLPGLGDENPDLELLSAQCGAVRLLVRILREKLTEDGLNSLIYDVEMPLVPILADIEITGVAVDKTWLEQLSHSLGKRILGVESEIFTLAGTDFNIGSPKQLGHILFDKLGLPSSKKTKTGYSTDADTLAALAPFSEIVPKIIEYRELTKLKSTYADSLPRLVDPVTGRIHTSLNQAVTATGRLSSSDPNLQNIPIKTEAGREIRRAFIASPGNVLVSADYSQIELRILAHVSHDVELCRAFTGDEDVHTKTATTIFDVSAADVTPEMRRQAKTVNFAVIY
ncbi:MAG TPA: DNA polymerase I, partial [Armatimonadota bacterium]